MLNIPHIRSLIGLFALGIMAGCCPTLSTHPNSDSGRMRIDGYFDSGGGILHPVHLTETISDVRKIKSIQKILSKSGYHYVEQLDGTEKFAAGYSAEIRFNGEIFTIIGGSIIIIENVRYDLLDQERNINREVYNILKK